MPKNSFTNVRIKFYTILNLVPFFFLLLVRKVINLQMYLHLHYVRHFFFFTGPLTTSIKFDQYSCLTLFPHCSTFCWWCCSGTYRQWKKLREMQTYKVFTIISLRVNTFVGICLNKRLGCRLAFGKHSFSMYQTLWQLSTVNHNFTAFTVTEYHHYLLCY